MSPTDGPGPLEPSPAVSAAGAAPSPSPVLGVERIGAPPWPTEDPFLFCVHHHDAYPAGDARLGPAASLAGRQLGMDFAGRDGWNMYHGRAVPGFPRHPHRGFETVTVVRRGTVDHADSLGATARYGAGDVQWLTAGAGIAHAEMFPLLRQDRDNPLELFQIWLNLPAADKMAPPHFTMFWRHQVPRLSVHDEAGRRGELTLAAGVFGAAAPPAPPPRSYASRADSDLAIWTLRLEPGARLTLPAAASAATRRSLYLFAGALQAHGHAAAAPRRLRLRGDLPATLVAGPQGAEALLLQGRPIGEPVAQHGPFVMNTRAELAKAYQDWQATGFGGWPWPADDPVHAPEAGRFARHASGRRDAPPG
jgi:redox-sensitive bicupin YhaK (pirin superfamily)